MSKATKTTRITTAITLLATLGVVAFGAQAGATDSISKAVKESSVNLEFRYRYELNDQDNGLKDGKASTLKTRLTVKTGKVNNFSAVVEVDHVAAFGSENYNNATGTGNDMYSVVADPDGLDLNQAYISYTGFENTTLSAGRQRLAHNGHRFLGTVGWRQNEQTYDAYRVQVQATDSVNVDYSYIYNANRIFGVDSAKGDLHGDFHALNVKFTPAKEHKFAFFAYLLDFDTAAANSSDTYGVDYKFATKVNNNTSVGMNLSYAMQSDGGDNPVSYDASYYLAEVNGKSGNFFGSIGYEVLGSDDGNKAFSTPFATLHKFNGWADMFLGTPNTGLEDLYVKIGTKVAGLKLTAVYHDYSANEGSADYGTELDLVAAYKVNKQVGLLVKYATYNADAYKVDTDKLWLMATMKF